MKPRLLLMILMTVSTLTFTSCGEDYDEIENGGSETNNGNGGQNSGTTSVQWPKVKFDTYHVAQGGTLPSLIGQDRKSLITHLKVTGYINSDDLNFIRMMTGVSFTSGSLQYLDLSEARIVAGGAGYSEGRQIYEVETDKINKYLFGMSPKLEGIRLPKTLKSIDLCAFWYCERLKIVEMPNSITTIGQQAFDGCAGLTSITIPNSVTNIGRGAFSGCIGLTSVNITDLASWCEIDFDDWSSTVGHYPSSYEGPIKRGYSNPLTYAQHLYLNGKEIKELIIPNTVTKIKELAFVNCTGLTSIKIPNSVTSIGDYAFKNCTGLTSITIPNSVTSIGDYAFKGCTGLTSITIPNSVTSIGDCVFWGTGLTSITIPNSITTIGNCAFLSCTGLTSITIPASVTLINSNAFFDCTNINEIHMKPITPPRLGPSVFGLVKLSCTVFVPKGSKESYNKDPWTKFEAIIEE